MIISRPALKNPLVRKDICQLHVAESDVLIVPFYLNYSIAKPLAENLLHAGLNLLRVESHNSWPTSIVITDDELLTVFLIKSKLRSASLVSHSKKASNMQMWPSRFRMKKARAIYTDMYQ